MKQQTDKINHSLAVNQNGLSLIELMISITIGLLILVSLSTMFVNQSKARAELDKSNRMIDNGRYALELMSSSLKLAGFYGYYEPPFPGTPTALPDPCDTAAMVDPSKNLDLLYLHVQGYDAATAAGAIAGTPPLCLFTYTAGSKETLKPGSDILVVRRAGTALFAQDEDHLLPLPEPQVAAQNNGTIYFQAATCQEEPEPPHTAKYMMSTDPAALNLGRRNITTPPPALNNCYAAGGVKHITPPFADLRALVVEAYFVSPDNNPGDGIPTLKRRELSATGGVPAFVTTPLVEGIEYMQVEYGVDTDSDGIPDNYTSCAACTLTEWSNVISVKLYLVARNIDPTSGYNDTKAYSLGLAGDYVPSGTGVGYKRHSYTQVVSLTNPSGRRLTP